MVVEITPIGIQNLQWKFYIIWTLFNFSFVPIVYFFYVSHFLSSVPRRLSLLEWAWKANETVQPETADRTLEDLDRYFRENHNIIVGFDTEATSSKRPAAYAEHEQIELRRNSSVAPGEVEAAAEQYRKGQLKGLTDHGKVGDMDGGNEKAELREEVEV